MRSEGSSTPKSGRGGAGDSDPRRRRAVWLPLSAPEARTAPMPKGDGLDRPWLLDRIWLHVKRRPLPELPERRLLPTPFNKKPYWRGSCFRNGAMNNLKQSRNRLGLRLSVSVILLAAVSLAATLSGDLSK